MEMGRDGGLQLQPRDPAAPAAAGRRQKEPTRAIRGSVALPRPWSWTSGPRTTREDISVVLSPQFVEICYGTNRTSSLSSICLCGRYLMPILQVEKLRPRVQIICLGWWLRGEVECGLLLTPVRGPKQPKSEEKLHWEREDGSRP